MPHSASTDPGAEDWWEDLLPVSPHRKPPGALEMLHLIAYDIACPKRLRRVAETCEDYGTRVQFSLFECWLDEARFEELWGKLKAGIVAAEDRLVAYRLDKAAAASRRTAGGKMIVTHEVRWRIA